jgi:hypothetical protein
MLLWNWDKVYVVLKSSSSCLLLPRVEIIGVHYHIQCKMLSFWETNAWWVVSSAQSPVNNQVSKRWRWSVEMGSVRRVMGLAVLTVAWGSLSYKWTLGIDSTFILPHWNFWKSRTQATTLCGDSKGNKAGHLFLNVSLRGLESFSVLLLNGYYKYLDGEISFPDLKETLDTSQCGPFSLTLRNRSSVQQVLL